MTRALVGVVMLDPAGELWVPGTSQRAFVTPVRVAAEIWGHESDAPKASVMWGEIIDLVAWHPNLPRTMRRTGHAEALGCYAPQYLDPDPVKVWRSPAGFLRARAQGVCLVTPDLGAQQRFLMGLHGIIAEDQDHAFELQRLLERPAYVPRVTIGGDVANSPTRALGAARRIT